MNSPNIVGLIRVYDNGQLHVDLPDGTIGCENWTSEQKAVAESVRESSPSDSQRPCSRK